MEHRRTGELISTADLIRTPMSARSLISMTLTALTLSLSACDSASDPTSPARAIGTLTTTSPAALVERDATPSVPFQLEGAQWVPCAAGGQGEWVMTSGLINYRAQRVTDGAGNEHVTVHANSQRLTGVGTLSGDTYQGSLRESRSTFESANGVFVGWLTERYHFVAPGNGSNFTLQLLLRITINPNGIAVSIEKVRATCG